jgi:hypothetical protein
MLEANDLQCLDALALGAIVCAAEGLTVRFANERAKAWFGSDLEGRPLASVIPSLSESAVTETLAKDRIFTLSGEGAPPHRRRDLRFVS